MMEQKELAASIHLIIDQVAQLIPFYMQQEEDRQKANNGIAVCIIDQQGNVYGKMFGTDKLMMRERYRIAWMKASQVWITGIKTGEFERRVFNNEIGESEFGIRKPDYIGWEGGQPITLKDASIIAAAFSGFRSATDLEIVSRAIDNLNL